MILVDRAIIHGAMDIRETERCIDETKKRVVVLPGVVQIK